ncbi:MAG: outer membrane protein transport protein [Rhizobiaceae bacterium]|nr:outer membrane protein transport protein [Rhizobiaceae bacterium]
MRLLTKILTAGTALAALATAAHAGGFNRGGANLEGLYGSGVIALYSGATFVSPGRSYTEATGKVVINGVPTPFKQTGIAFGDDYYIPYASVGGRMVGDLSCVGSYSQPFGADTTYEGEMTYHKSQEYLSTDEYGLTCGYGFDVGPGRLSVIGGGFYETIEYAQARSFEKAFGTVGDSKVELESGAFGYRLGLGYEMPEIGLKAQLMYRSATNHDGEGAYTNTPFRTLAIAGGMPANIANAIYGNAMTAPASATQELPQSLEFSMQTGIAPGWLAFGLVKWTDWSVLQQLVVTEQIGGRAFGPPNFFFEDNWVVTGGIVRRFTDQLAVSGLITWDKGVTTGWDTLTDTWTFGSGVVYDVSEKFQVRAGGAAIYFLPGEKTNTASAVADYTAYSPAEWGYALQAALTLRF